VVSECILKSSKLRRLSLDYIAGLFDGEGNAGLYPHIVRNNIDFQPVINISSSDEDVIFSIKYTLGFGKVRRRKQKSGNVIFIWWVFQRDQILEFIRLIKDRCLIKQKQLILLEKALQYIPSYENRIFYRNLDTILKLIYFVERLRQLNSKNRRRNNVDLNKLREIAIKKYKKMSKRELKTANLPADLLKHLYWKKEMSSYEIAEKLGITQSTVIKYMKLHKIPRRRRGGSHGAN